MPDWVLIWLYNSVPLIVGAIFGGVGALLWDAHPGWGLVCGISTGEVLLAAGLTAMWFLVGGAQ